jgi:serine/threonine protein phosphatase PrpC
VFKIIDCISNSSPNAFVNEDAIGAASAGAWVIDGATGVSDRPPLVTGTTDAAWLTGRLNAELRAMLDETDVDLVQVLTEVEAKVQTDFLAIDREFSGPAWEQPSAALALAALQGKALHLIGIGDCRIIYEAHTGKIGEFNPSEGAAAEALIVAERSRLVTEYPGEDPWPRLKGFIRKVRELANQDGGYFVVHPIRAWRTHVKQEIHEASEIRHLLLLSDGLYRLVDIFGLMTAAELMQRALAKELHQLYSELRGLELTDVDCADYPRAKTHDDVSAILVALTDKIQ